MVEHTSTAKIAPGDVKTDSSYMFDDARTLLPISNTDEQIDPTVNLAKAGHGHIACKHLTIDDYTTGNSSAMQETAPG